MIYTIKTLETIKQYNTLEYEVEANSKEEAIEKFLEENYEFIDIIYSEYDKTSENIESVKEKEKLC